MNPFLVILLSVAAVGAMVGAVQFGKLGSFSDKLTTDLKSRVHSVDFSKVTFAFEPIIKNPTNTRVYILQPYVKVFYKGKEIASSNVSDRIIRIEPFSQPDPFTIYIDLRFMNAGGLVLELLSRIQDKSTKVTLTTEIHLNLVLGIKEPLPESERLRDYTGAYQLIPKTITKEVSY